MHIDAGRDITLVGTAHISKKSIKEVREVINKEKPKIVAVELDQARYDALTKKKRWEETSIAKILKEGKMFLVLAQIILAMIQRKLSKEGVRPGAEMVAAIRVAKKNKCEIALVDRDITITLKRAWANMGGWEKFKLFFYFMIAIMGLDRLKEEAEEIDIDKMTEDQDLISMMMEELRKVAPAATKTLIDERDAYLAKRIIETQEEKDVKVVGVIGAGHLKGVVRYLKKPEKIPDLKELEIIPTKRVKVSVIFGWWLTAMILGLFAFVFWRYGIWKVVEMGIWWFLINGILASLGAILAGGHPLTWLVAFVAAPFTSLNPLIGAGWVAGYVEAVLRVPKVKDLQKLSTMETFREMYRNQFVRVLLVASLVNLGSSIGTFVAIPVIAWLGLT
jgi:pheromone shutdown-related protein TraB